MSAEPRQSMHAARVRIWQLALPVLWIGLIIAISFIEAPLKFQAPGITIPLGLGIGRLVFTALNVLEIVLLVVLSVVSFWPAATRLTRTRMAWLGALWVVVLVKIAGVRPPLNTRTDLVLAGADPGQSPWHYVYIGLEVATLGILLVCTLLAAREIVRRLVALPAA